MNKFEKKAMAKRAYKALVKMGGGNAIYTGYHKPVTTPEATTFDELMYNKADWNTATKSFDGRAYRWWSDDTGDPEFTLPYMDNKPAGKLTQLADNAAYFSYDPYCFYDKDNGSPYKEIIRLPHSSYYKRLPTKNGPWLSREAAEAMADNLVDKYKRVDPKNGPGGVLVGGLVQPDLARAYMDYFPASRDRLDGEYARKNLPERINLED